MEKCQKREPDLTLRSPPDPAPHQPPWTSLQSASAFLASWSRDLVCAWGTVSLSTHHLPKIKIQQCCNLPVTWIRCWSEGSISTITSGESVHSIQTHGPLWEIQTRTLFLGRLPNSVHMVLASTPDGTTLDKLSEMADKVMCLPHHTVWMPCPYLSLLFHRSQHQLLALLTCALKEYTVQS